MSVAVCLLATSLLACEWHRPDTGPRLRPTPIEVAAREPAAYNDSPAARLRPEPVEAAARPAVTYSDSVVERIGLAEPDSGRFGELAYVVPAPATYGDYPEPPKYKNKREKQRAERKAKREMLIAVKEFKVKKTRAVFSQEALAYAAPAERKNWLASIFNSVDNEEEAPGKEPSARGSGYDAVRDAARRYGPGGRKFEKLAHDITYTESRGRCGAVSSAKALGVMQTKLGTAQMMGYKGGAHGLKNCRTGAEWGVKYLAYCHGLAKGDIRLTSVCYNQGHGVLTNPRKYGKRAKRKEAVNYVATMRSRGWRM